MDNRCRFSRLVLPLILTLSGLLMAGCAGGGEEILLEDRFGNPNGIFGNESQDAFDRGYHDGRYFIEVYEPNWLVWARPEERFTDVDIEVDARWISGSLDSHFGLICRYRPPDSFYYFSVTPDGYYAILRVEDGVQEVLSGETFASSSIILPGERTNTIRALCYREQLSLYVNEERVATATDDRFRRGDVALAVGSGPEGAARVHFDNLVVTGPDF